MAFRVYSQEGRDRLAAIIKNARGGRSYREFEKIVGGITHSTLVRIENAESDPSDKTLLELAKVTPYSYVELKAIVQNVTPPDIRKYVTAEDVMTAVKNLKIEEIERLIAMLVRHAIEMVQSKDQ